MNQYKKQHSSAPKTANAAAPLGRAPLGRAIRNSFFSKPSKKAICCYPSRFIQLANYLISKLANSLMSKLANSLMSKLANSLISKLANVIISKLSNFQIVQFSNFQIFKFSNCSIFKFSNCSINKLTNYPIITLISFLLLFNLQSVQAQFEAGIKSTTLAKLGNTNTATAGQYRSDSLAGNAITAGANIALTYQYQVGETSRKIRNTIWLKLNEATPTFIPTDFNASINLTVERKTSYLDPTPITENKTLVVSYSKLEGTKYNPIAYFNLPLSEYVKITVNGAPTITGLTNGFTAAQVLALLKLENEMEETRYFTMSSNPNDLLANYTGTTCPIATSTDDEFTVKWSYPATAYNNMTHLEWTWVEDEMLPYYYFSGTTNINYDFLFSNNSTRVDLAQQTLNQYSIPLLYDGVGKLYYRTRAVYRNNDNTVFTGPWSNAQSCSFNGHEPALNWQSSTSFAEEGKRKTVIQYFDGSLRGRQTVTKDNVRGNTIVAETLYDLQGRANVQILPTPTIGNKIKYFEDFNRFQGQGPNDDPAKYFDLTPVTANRCGIGPALDTTKGNGRYYSANNDWLSLEAKSKYIASAEGYAYTETRFMDDATQRVLSQGGVGKTHQIGNGHQTNYFYGKPAQEELDALFGSQVGDATHYSKNMVQDANGQMSVSYVDMHGRTIATALAGGNPANLKSLNPSSYYPIASSPITTKLITPQNNIVQGNKIEAISTLLIPQDNTAANFSYNLTPEILSLNSCTGAPVCLDCKYDLEITLRQEGCADTIYTYNYNNLSPVAANDSCSNPMGFTGMGITTPTSTINFSRILNAGSWVIRKTLTLNDSIFQIRKAQTLNQFLCKTEQQIYDSVFNVISTQTGCGLTAAQQCDSCISKLGTLAQYINNYQASSPNSGYTIAQITGFYQADSLACVAACNGTTLQSDIGNTLAGYRKQMLDDMKPFTGQYAGNPADFAPHAAGSLRDKYNIFTNPAGSPANTRPYYKKPNTEQNQPYYYNALNIIDNLTHGLDANGDAFLVNMGITDFASLYTPSWGKSLIKYHPEYSKLVYAETQLKSSFDYLDQMQQAATYDNAQTNINPATNIANNNYLNPLISDPFYQNPANALAKQRMQVRLYQSVQVGNPNTAPAQVAGVPSIWQLSNGGVNCATVPEAQRLSCMMAQNATGLHNNITLPAQKTKVWESFRNMYLSYRNEDVMAVINGQPGALSAADMLTLQQTDSCTLVFVNQQQTANQNGWGTWWAALVDPAGPNTAPALVYAGNNPPSNPCVSQKPFWRARLLQCEAIKTLLNNATTNDTTLANNIINTILTGLAQVCNNSRDAQNPDGASNVRPGNTSTPQNFEQVINAAFAQYNIPLTPQTNGSNPQVGYYCNPFTIDYPKPYGKNTPIAVNYSNQLDTCACTQFGIIKNQATAAGFNPNSLSSLNQFLLANNYGDTLSQVVFNGLQNCSGNGNPCNSTCPPPKPVIYNVTRDALNGGFIIRIPADYNCQNCVVKIRNQAGATVSTQSINCLKMNGSTNHNAYEHNIPFADTCGKYNFQLVCPGICGDTLLSNVFKYGGCCLAPQIDSIVNISNQDSCIRVRYQLPVGTTSASLQLTYSNGIVLYQALNVNSSSFIWCGLDSTQSFTLQITSSKSTAPVCDSIQGNVMPYTVPCVPVILLAEPAIIPLFLNCGYVKPCINCDTFKSLHNQFKALYPTFAGVPYTTGNNISEAQGQQNNLWVRFINYRTGFNKTFADYALAYTNCINATGNGDTATLSPCPAGSAINILNVYNRLTTVSNYVARQEINFLPNNFTNNNGDYYNAYINPNAPLCDTSQAGGSGNTVGANPNFILCGLGKPISSLDNLPKDTSGPCQPAIEQAIYVASQLLVQRKEVLLAKFDSLYKAKCLAAASRELFSVSYLPMEYHYTLYYYDQGGSLVKTLPPAAVKPNYNAAYLTQVAAARANNTAVVENSLLNQNLATNYRYNSLGQVVVQKTPDAGISQFWYDELGRLVVSQNAKQALANNYSYTIYDDLGRISQVGQKPQAAILTQSIAQNATQLSNWLSNLVTGGLKEQITRTVYDVKYYDGSSNTQDPLDPEILVQQNLRNRVSYTQIIKQEPAGGTGVFVGEHAAATYYSYDIHGNVDTLVQDMKEATSTLMNVASNRFKKMVYDYDLISGKVNKVSYQPGKTDQYYHKYAYDAENKLTETFTSADGIYWEQEASYDYHRHGPLARTVIGQNRVQGVDYAYTVQGWLKGVNSTYAVAGATGSGLNNNDMGADGQASDVAKDAFGFSLNYFNNGSTESDYKPIDATLNPFMVITNGLAPVGDATLVGNNLYNGNIKAMMVNIPKLTGGNNGILYGYQYDQLNRITAMNAYKGNGNATAPALVPSTNYKERINYDPNGNILNYVRYGDDVEAGTASNQSMDSLSYNYNIVNGQLVDNRLNSVSDGVIGNAYTKDIKNQNANNYNYDAIGNLIQDNTEGISNIKWNVYGKIEQITKTNLTIINYTYDVAGNRITKQVIPATGVAELTVYVRDATGNVMAVYQNQAPNTTVASASIFTQSEVHLYGSSRLGVNNINRAATNIATVDFTQYSTTFTRANKFFELSNHLGNVLVTITDRKLQIQSTTQTSQVAYYQPDIATAGDYYPFGMAMPGRSFSSGAEYRYGFNGQEKDKNINGGALAFEARIYDSRIGRFFSKDPRESEYPWQSTYAYFKNCPIIIIDFLGKGGPDDPIIIRSGPTSMQAALMSQHVYADPEVEVKLKGGWKVSEKRTLIKIENGENGFKSQLYERTTKDGAKQYTYAFAGTEERKLDGVEDVTQILGLSKQYDQAVTNAKVLAKELDGQLFFTGHSLGGGLATVAGLATEKNVIAFNPAWMSRQTAIRYDILFTEAFQTNYIVKGEILNLIQKAYTNREISKSIKKAIFSELRLLQQRGVNKTIKRDLEWYDYLNPKTSLDSHKMENVIKALENERIKNSPEKIDASEKIPNKTQTYTA